MNRGSERAPNHWPKNAYFVAFIQLIDAQGKRIKKAMIFNRFPIANSINPADVTPIAGFDGAFYINCEKSVDRKRQFLIDANENCIFPIRINGVVPTDDDLDFLGYGKGPYKKRLRGEIGCAASHFMAIAEAKRLNLKSVIVFEDDAAFLENWTERASQFRAALNCTQWDLAYFAAFPSVPAERIHPQLLLSKGAWSSFAYAMNSTYFDQFLNSAARPIGAIDCFFYHRAIRQRFILFNDPLNYHRTGESVIGGNGHSTKDFMISRYSEYCK